MLSAFAGGERGEKDEEAGEDPGAGWKKGQFGRVQLTPKRQGGREDAMGMRKERDEDRGLAEKRFGEFGER